MKILLFTILILSGGCLKAQTWSEWFDQGNTQRKYLAEQIAALQTYLDYAKKGYNIVREGLQTIGDIKNGDLNLHRAYFLSEQTVNPTVKHTPTVSDILNRSTQILSVVQSVRRNAQSTALFRANDRDYINRVLDNMVSKNNEQLDALSSVITNGELTMKDEERLTRINRIDKAVIDQYTFICHFSNEVKTIAAGRNKEQKEIQTIQSFYSIQP